MTYQVFKSQLSGILTVPSSKSHTLRAILFASLAKGESQIHAYLPSPDAVAMIAACRLLGAKITIEKTTLYIEGVAGNMAMTENVIDAGNSGQVLRFVAAIAALSHGYTVLTGDASIRHNRPVRPLLEALTQRGAFAVSTRLDGFAPIVVRGPLQAGKVTIEGRDSQPVSGLLMALAFAQGKSEIEVRHAGEKPWVNLTLSWFDRLGIPYRHENFEHYWLEGGAAYEGFEYTVPGDFSSLAFPLAAALITHSEICLENVDMQEVQGDKAIIPVLQQMGAILEIDATQKRLYVRQSPRLKGIKINVNNFIDAVPILAAVACFASGETEIVGAAIAREKESDRLTAIAAELKKMGADIQVYEDGLRIRGKSLYPAAVESHHDHRIAMACATVGLALLEEEPTIVHNTKCVAKSFPEFITQMQQLGAKIGEV